MNLLIITQKVDAEDDLLGFFVDWIKEFAKHFERVVVISLAKGNYDLPANVFVYSLGKELGRSKLRQLFTLLRLLWRFVPKSQGIFAHMSPIFVIVAWPFAFLNRKKIILWYLHRSVTAKLKLAEWFSYKIVTADRTSLRINSKKIIETGHGIDLDKFKTTRLWLEANDHQWQILSVGRISPIKDYETLVHAGRYLRDKNINFRIKIIGRPIMPHDDEYLERLQKMIKNEELSDYIKFSGFVPYVRIADEYKSADIVVGMTPKGGLDKSLLEAMASGALIISSNSAMAKYLGDFNQELLFDFGNAEDMANKIINAIKWSNDKKNSVSEFLVDSVGKSHNLIKLIERISKLYE